MGKLLFHFSENPNITYFEPRPVHREPELGSVVWAIEATAMYKNLLPRDCPRVTFYADENSSPEDVERLLGHTTAKWIVAIESGWLERMRTVNLYRYHLPAKTFKLVGDGIAGYYASHEPVEPLSVEPVGDLLKALIDFGVELRITPSLWPLHKAVVNSTLPFSMIRMRNATPPEN